MGRAPCCDKANVKKGPWSPEEDSKLKEFIEKYGTGGNWIALPQKAGLKRCGKSCRLRWLNYLRPNIKHGEFSDDEDRIICSLFASIGSRWSVIAARLPGRTDNDIKNYWNTKLKKKLMGMMVNSSTTQRPKPPQLPPPLFPTHHLHQTLPPLPLSPSSHQSLYKDHCSLYYTPSTKSLTCLDQPLSLPSNLLNNLNVNNPTSTTTTNSFDQTIQNSLLQSQDIINLMGSSMQYYPLPKDNNLLMFGGDNDQPSCNQISYTSKDIKIEDMGFHDQGFISNGYEENQRFMVDYGHNGGDHHHDHDHDNYLHTWADHEQKSNGYFGNNNNSATTTTATTLEYDLMEVKQLINSSTNTTSASSDNGGCSSYSFSLNDDQNNGKIQKMRAMYYY